MGGADLSSLVNYNSRGYFTQGIPYADELSPHPDLWISLKITVILDLKGSQ